MKPIYDNYEIHGCVTVGHDLNRDASGGYSSGRDYAEQCDDSEADFWTLYGHITGQGVEAIGDFKSREAAEECYYRITGQAFGTHEENAAADSIEVAYRAMQRLYQTYCDENDPADVLPFQEFCEWKAEQEQLIAEQTTS